MSETVDHPAHYNAHPSGVECIDVVEHMTFNVGNAIKYLWRAGQKGDLVEDLRKAAWYIEREIQRVSKNSTRLLVCEAPSEQPVMSHQSFVDNLPKDWRLDLAHLKLIHTSCGHEIALPRWGAYWFDAQIAVRDHVCSREDGNTATVEAMQDPLMRSVIVPPYLQCGDWLDYGHGKTRCQLPVSHPGQHRGRVQPSDPDEPVADVVRP